MRIAMVLVLQIVAACALDEGDAWEPTLCEPAMPAEGDSTCVIDDGRVGLCVPEHGVTVCREPCHDDGCPASTERTETAFGSCYCRPR
jgi:hypothetical protein